jgi:ribose transport system substrate-binding protein
LFGTNENNTENVGIAIQASNKNIIGIGFDLTDIIQKQIQDGYIKATMVQNPYTMGYLGMAEAVAALKGLDTGPSYIDTGVSVRTRYTH